MVSWRMQLAAYGKRLETVEITRGNLPGVCLFLLLFVLCIIFLTLIPWFSNSEYVFKNMQQKNNHYLFMDGLKPYGKDEPPIISLLDIVYNYSADI